MHIDSFCGRAADLPRPLRSAANVLLELSKDPRVSTWDMEQDWLRNCLKRLELDGLIRAEDAPYPWLRYSLTNAGRDSLGKQA